MGNKFCTKCGSEIKNGTKFCISCGQPVTKRPQSPIHVEKTPPINEEQPQYVQAQPQPQYVQPQNAPRQKKKKGIGCLISILAVFGIFVVTIIFIISMLLNEPEPVRDINVNNNSNTGNSEMNTSDEMNTPDELNTPDDDNISSNQSPVDDSLPEYTFMVYMNGSDLESEYFWDEDVYGAAATYDILEMAAVGSNDELNIILETGGTSYWDNPVIDPTQNQRYLVVKDDLVLLEDLGARNMGSSDTLYDFIVWTVQNYPAQKYVLDFWNHGGGPLYGFGSDELFSVEMDGYEVGEFLSLPEIEDALRRAKESTDVHFEVIGFDACLMASVEVAHMVSPYANYLVASEELEPGHGWNYEGIITQLMLDPTISGAGLGMIISDQFYEQAVEYDTVEMITLSVIDLSMIQDVVIALENLSSDMMADMSEISTINMIAGGRSRAESYGSNTPFSGYTELIDLYDFSGFLMGNQLEEATALRTAIDSAVIYQVRGPSRLFGGGLSVYFPYMDQEDRKTALINYSEINEIDTYEIFLQNFIDILDADTEGTNLKSRTLQEEDDGSFTVVISEEDRENVLNIYNFVGIALDENIDSVLSLGYDSDIYYDIETGIVKDNFTGWWTGINGHLVTLNIIEETDDYNLYSVPAIVNGNEIEIIGKWYWDDTFAEGGYYEVLGGWALADEYSLMSEKSFIDLKIGDAVEFQFEVLDMVYEDDFIFAMDEIILQEEPYMGFVELASGEQYIYAFYFEDYSLNGIFSEYTVFDLID